MDPAKCYRFSRRKLRRLPLDILLETHPDSFYRILSKASMPLAILSYAGRKQHLEILKAVLDEKRDEILSETPERISYEYYQNTPETREILKDILHVEPIPNCQIS